jgi:hypothetical protein
MMKRPENIDSSNGGQAAERQRFNRLLNDQARFDARLHSRRPQSHPDQCDVGMVSEAVQLGRNRCGIGKDSVPVFEGFVRGHQS